MSYTKMMKWNKKRPKGTKQPIIMSTNSGFWPSGAFVIQWVKYAEGMEAKGLPYLSSEEYYKSQLNK